MQFKVVAASWSTFGPSVLTAAASDIAVVRGESDVIDGGHEVICGAGVSLAQQRSQLGRHHLNRP